MSDKTKKNRQNPPAMVPFKHSFAVHALNRARQKKFDLRPDPTELSAIADFLKVLNVRDLRFKGFIEMEGDEGWRASGRLTGKVDQACVVTLTPVPQEIDEEVTRLYLPNELLESSDEIELDPEEDDETDGFDETIDVGELMLEALALALDPYPRAEGAEMDTSAFAPPGTKPLSDEDVKPFAKLAALREKMGNSDS
jgi:uncharacterized metal-binding protein YceD (DUF177 family)